ncbi:MAG: hypothetical protein KBB32_09085, partial [Spirochaetia bacterium]|nr:hypothetical protein [Spirochaetia bacterium]
MKKTVRERRRTAARFNLPRQAPGRILRRRRLTTDGIGLDRAALLGAADECERVFGCPVLFDPRGVGMLVPLDVFKLPSLAPNGILLERLEEWARSYL